MLSINVIKRGLCFSTHKKSQVVTEFQNYFRKLIKINQKIFLASIIN